MDYLLAALAYEINDYESSLKMISKIITSNAANSRMKDKARDLKEKIAEKARNGAK